jgi:hypothetical protein
MDRTQIEQARPGDRISVAARRVGQTTRTGEVVEVLGEAGEQRCRVRWDDGHETLLYPGTDAIVERQDERVVA